MIDRPAWLPRWVVVPLAMVAGLTAIGFGTFFSLLLAIELVRQTDKISNGEWLQAISAFAGAVLAGLISFAVAVWSFKRQESVKAERDREMAARVTQDFSAVGNEDLEILKDAVRTLLVLNDTKTLIPCLAKFGFIPGQSPVRDAAIIRAAPRMFDALVRLRETREYARRRGEGHNDALVAHWDTTDFLWAIATNWAALLEAARHELGSERVSVNPSDDFRALAAMLLPFAPVTSKRIEFATRNSSMPRESKT